MFEKDLPILYDNAPIRQEQVQLALDVADYLFNSHKKFMFIDAPVGTGKSMGVLIPALLYAKRNNERVLYATATISLQNQIMNEEVPKLKKMNLVENTILAIGKNNYSCEMNYLSNKSKFSLSNQKELDKYFSDFGSGQISEVESQSLLTQQELNYIRMQQNGKSRNCNDCLYKDDCNTIKHRKKYRSEYPKNDLTVTNHDQMIASQVLFERGRNPIVPINNGIIIVDEAHLFQENYLGRTQYEVPFGELVYLTSLVNEKISSHLKRKHKQIIKNGESMQGTSSVTMDNKQILLSSVKALKSLEIRESMKKHNNEDQLTRISDCIDSLNKIISDENISWIDIESKKYCSASKKFLPEFKRFITNLTNHNKVIFMSGTLTGTGKKEDIQIQWGLPQDSFTFYKYKTPFNYSDQAKVYIPSNLSEPKHESNNHLYDVIQRIERINDITQGNMLVLCTSKLYMSSISNKLKNKLNNEILTQGDKNIDTLTKKFKAGEKVLIGSGAFFNGFSVAGQALSSVVLTRLPFPTPDNPLVRLISIGLTEREKNDKVVIPMMFNKLHQAMGRLIRDVNDYGVVSILDPRVHTKSYGIAILGELSDLGYGVTKNIMDIVNFYEKSSDKEKSFGTVKYKRSDLVRIPSIDTERDREKMAEVMRRFLDKGNQWNRDEIPLKAVKRKTIEKIKDDEIRIARSKAKDFAEKVGGLRSSGNKFEIDRLRMNYLIEFRKSLGLRLFTANQQSEGIERCFFYTLELIKQKVLENQSEVIEQLFNEFPFIDKIEKSEFRMF